MNSLEPPRPPSPASRRLPLLVGGALVLAALAAYQSTWSAPFIMDDVDSILENATIHHLWPPWSAFAPAAGGATVSGRPLLNFSFALNYALGGEAVGGYHAVNLALHLLAAGTLFGVVRLTLQSARLRPRFGAASRPLAAACAGLWLLHPLATAAVSYVSQRAESLASLFCLLTVYAFARAETDPGPLRPRSWRVLSWLTCLLGMATKEITAALPLLVLAYDVTVSGDRLATAWRRRRAYYLALAATWLLLAGLVAGNHTRGGTAGFATGLTPLAYLQTQCHAVVVYLGLCFWPHPLVFDRGLVVVRGFAAVWPQALLLVALLLGTAVALWRRSFAGLLGAWCFAVLAPSSSIVPVASETMAEHRMYLPLAAVVTLTVTGTYAIWGRRSLLVWPGLAAGLGLLTYERNQVYRSELALWADTVAQAPHNARGRYNLAIALSQQGRYAEAVAQSEAALQSDAGWTAAAQAPATHNKLGTDLAALGRDAEAIVHFEAALRGRPGYGAAHLNLARALVRLARPAEAIPHFVAAQRLRFGGAATAAELGDTLLHDGRLAEAVEAYRSVVQQRPDWAPGCNNLAYALLLTGEIDASIAAYREAVRLDPRYAAAWVGLGYAFIQARRPAEAIPACREAVRLQPTFGDAHNTLGIALAEVGQTAAAVACFQTALSLPGAGPDVHHNLGNALATLGRTREAIAAYREAVRVDPDYAPAHRSLAEELQRAGQSSEAAEHRDAAARLESATAAHDSAP